MGKAEEMTHGALRMTDEIYENGEKAKTVVEDKAKSVGVPRRNG